MSLTSAAAHWQPQGPWLWTHGTQGTIDLQRTSMDVCKHKLRASWRRTLWASFMAQCRRDGAGLAGTVRRAVLVGAANSLATYQKIYEGDVTAKCHVCGRSVVPSWEHAAWSCLIDLIEVVWMIWLRGWAGPCRLEPRTTSSPSWARSAAR